MISPIAALDRAASLIAPILPAGFSATVLTSVGTWDAPHAFVIRHTPEISGIVLRGTTVASRARVGASVPHALTAKIIFAVDDPSHVQALRTRMGDGDDYYAGSARQVMTLPADEIHALAHAAIARLLDRADEITRRLSLASDPEGVDRREASTKGAVRARMEGYAAKLAGTIHEAEARRIVAEWTGESRAEGRIKRLKKMLKDIE